MDLPFHLRTLEPLPGALDILRYFGSMDTETADAEEIADELELSDRRTSKAIRRLVTKGYIVMDGDMIYRLSEQGYNAVEELTEYDEANGTGLNIEPPTIPQETVQRRLVLAVPAQLVANQQVDVFIGFHQGAIQGTTEMAVRLSVINGEPTKPDDAIFSLSGEPTHQKLTIQPGQYDAVRIKVQAIQLGPNPGDFNEAGGMYIDMPVHTQANQDGFTAFGTTINLVV